MNSQKSKLGVWWEKAILLIEDNQDDALLTARALHKIQPDLNVKIVENGRAAIGYLRGEGPYSDRRKYPLPDLVLLDWLMAGSSGEEVLQWMRAERALEGMGVVVMTGSAKPEHAKKAYASGADSYLLKPTDYQIWLRMLEAVVFGWFRCGQIPYSVYFPPSGQAAEEVSSFEPPYWRKHWRSFGTTVN